MLGVHALCALSVRQMPLLLITMCASAGEAALSFHDVPADGNCLFSSVALSAALTDGIPEHAHAPAVQEASKRLRSEALDCLCPSGVPDPELTLGGLPASLLIEPLNGEDEAGYCQRLRRSGQWGSTAEILALTRVLKRPINVYTQFGLETYGSDESANSARAPLSIHFHQNHYRAVTTPSSEHERDDDAKDANKSEM